MDGLALSLPLELMQRRDRQRGSSILCKYFATASLVGNCTIQCPSTSRGGLAVMAFELVIFIHIAVASFMPQLNNAAERQDKEIH